MVGSRGKQAVFFKVVLHIFFILLSLCFIIPIWAIIAISLTQETDILKYGYQLIPKNIDFAAYSFILKEPTTILSAYKVTIITSVTSTVLYLLIGSMAAYALSRNNFKYRKIITLYYFFTMLFSGGLVPSYILIARYLHLKNSIWVLILPGLANVWNMILMRTFFQQLPSAIFDSATIDGASEFRIYYALVLPLSKPVLATVGLLTMLSSWNAWFEALLYITKPSLYPLQYLLQVMLLNLQMLLNLMTKDIGTIDLSLIKVPAEAVRMAMCVLAVGPMLFVFPFFQKYFSKGLTVGSIKG